MKAYIFDLFGTLITDDRYKPWDNLVEELLGDINPKIRKEVMNKKDYKSDSLCLLTLKKESKVHWDKKRREMVLATFKQWRDAQAYYPSTKKVLIELRKRGYKLAIVSNNNNFCEDVIYRLKLEKLVDVIILSHKVGLRKPDPKIYKKCIQELNVKMNEGVFVGDDLEKDVLIPKSLGMKSILFDPKKQHKEFTERIVDLKELL